MKAEAEAYKKRKDAEAKVAATKSSLIASELPLLRCCGHVFSQLESVNVVPADRF